MPLRDAPVAAAISNLLRPKLLSMSSQCVSLSPLELHPTRVSPNAEREQRHRYRLHVALVAIFPGIAFQPAAINFPISARLADLLRPSASSRIGTARLRGIGVGGVYLIPAARASPAPALYLYPLRRLVRVYQVIFALACRGRCLSERFHNDGIRLVFPTLAKPQPDWPRGWPQRN